MSLVDSIEEEYRDKIIALEKEVSRLKDIKEENVFLRRQAKNTDARIERLIQKIVKYRKEGEDK